MIDLDFEPFEILNLVTDPKKIWLFLSQAIFFKENNIVHIFIFHVNY